MNYKPNKQRKAQRPSKQTTKELAAKIINLANKKDAKQNINMSLQRNYQLELSELQLALIKPFIILEIFLIANNLENRAHTTITILKLEKKTPRNEKR